MDRLKAILINLEHQLHHVSTGIFADVDRTFDDPFIFWNAMNQCLFVEMELRILHNRFAHPHTNKLYNFLKYFELKNVDRKTCQTMEDISRICMECHTYAIASMRFKFNF